MADQFSRFPETSTETGHSPEKTPEEAVDGAPDMPGVNVGEAVPVSAPVSTPVEAPPGLRFVRVRVPVANGEGFASIYETADDNKVPRWVVNLDFSRTKRPPVIDGRPFDGTLQFHTRGGGPLDLDRLTLWTRRSSQGDAAWLRSRSYGRRAVRDERMAVLEADIFKLANSPSRCDNRPGALAMMLRRASSTTYPSTQHSWPTSSSIAKNPWTAPSLFTAENRMLASRKIRMAARSSPPPPCRLRAG
jgi:hypothetical protein